jgi:hypothetical protein
LFLLSVLGHAATTKFQLPTEAAFQCSCVVHTTKVSTPDWPVSRRFIFSTSAAGQPVKQIVKHMSYIKSTIRIMLSLLFIWLCYFSYFEIRDYLSYSSMNDFCSGISKGESVEAIIDFASKQNIEANIVGDSLILHKSRCLCELKTIHNAIDDSMGTKCID